MTKWCFRKQVRTMNRYTLLIVKLERSFKTAVALTAVLGASLGISNLTPRALGQVAAQASVRADADIQSDVGYALMNSKTLKGQSITAATVEGDVTLSGNVRDAASKELAESLVAQVNGVRAVTNNLTIGETSQQQGQVAGGEDTIQNADPNADPQQVQASDSARDPSYDPAQQNMAQAGPEDQGPPQQGPPQNEQGNYGYPPPQQQQQQRGNYSAQPQAPSGPVTVPAGTLLQVRTSEPLDSNRLQPGALFQATVAQDVYQGGVLALPRGAVIQGQVVNTKTNKGELTGSQGLALKLNSISMAGQTYNLTSDMWSGQGPGKGAYSATNTIGGATMGAVIGAIAGRGPGAAVGAVAGGALGAGASAATNGPRMALPPEAVLNFHLTAPVTVTPVSGQEAQRLAASATPQQPQLRQRYGYGPYGYPPPPPPPGYYYGYYRYPYPAYYRPGYYYYGYRY